MVTKYGMSEKLGPIALEGTGGRMTGGGYSEDRGFSPQVAKMIDDEVSDIIQQGKDRAHGVLTRHKDALDAISKKLLEVETLERDEYEALLKQYGVEIKDAYKDIYKEEDKHGDPSKSLETSQPTEVKTEE